MVDGPPDGSDASAWDGQGQQNDWNSSTLQEHGISGSATFGGTAAGPPQEEFKDEDNEIVESVDEESVHGLCCVAIDGSQIGIPKNTQLRGFDSGQQCPTQYLRVLSGEVFTRSLFQFTGTIIRSVKKDNPEKTKNFQYIMEVNGMDVIDMQVSENLDDLPEYFKTAEGSNPEHLFRISFKTKHLRLMAQSVPPLQSPEAEEQLKSILSSLRLSIRQQKIVEVDVILYAANGQFRFWHALVDQIAREKSNDPAMRMIKDSPTLHRLRTGNIIPMAMRPVSSPGLTLRRRHTHRDTIDFKIASVYGAQDEYAASSKTAAAIKGIKFQGVFEAIPCTIGRRNVNDNDLPKAYLLTVIWDPAVPRPGPGAMILDMGDYDLPAVIHPSVNNCKVKGRFIDTGAEDDEDGGDIGGSAQDREEHARWQATRWQARVLPPNALSGVKSSLTLLVLRPADDRYLGLKQDQPSVGTVVPTVNSHTRQLLVREQYIHSAMAKKELVSLKLVPDDKGFKNTVRLINDLAEMYEKNNGAPSQSLPIHLLNIVMSGDGSLPFPARNFFADIGRPDAIQLIEQICYSPQRDQMIKVERVAHGVIMFVGCPGATKSYCSNFLAVLAANAKEGRVVLVTSDSNSVVNEQANSIVGICHQTKKSLKMVRLLPAGKDQAMVFAHFNPTPFAKVVLLENDSSVNEVDFQLNELVKQDAERKKAWDTRIVDVREYTLLQAVKVFSDANPHNVNLGKLLKAIEQSTHNPQLDHNGRAEMNSSYDALIKDVLAEMDICLVTTSTACSPKIGTLVRPWMVVHDEDNRSSQLNDWAMLAAFPDLRYLLLNADLRQPSVYLPSAMSGVPGLYAKHTGTSLIARLREVLDDSLLLTEQMRMHNPVMVRYNSQRHLQRLMKDGCERLSVAGLTSISGQNKIVFVNKVIANFFNRKPCNYLFVVLSRTKAFTPEGTNTTSNNGMLALIKKLCIYLKSELERADLGFDTATFSVGIVSPYKGITDPINQWVRKFLRDSRFQAMTIPVVQGLGRDLIIKALPQSRLGVFGTNAKDSLVLDTRYRFGMIHLVTSEALDRRSYEGLYPTNVSMRVSGPAQHIAVKLQHCEQEGLVQRMACTQTQDCDRCGSSDHQRSRCHVKLCHNCQLPGHNSGDCKDPRVIEEPMITGKETVCHRCNQTGHKRADCHLPYCKTCDTTAHGHLECPKNFCKLCNVIGHRTGYYNPDNLYVSCENAPICGKCGAKGHKPKKCPRTPDELRTVDVDHEKFAEMKALSMAVQEGFDKVLQANEEIREAEQEVLQAAYRTELEQILLAMEKSYITMQEDVRNRHFMEQGEKLSKGELTLEGLVESDDMTYWSIVKPEDDLEDGMVPAAMIAPPWTTVDYSAIIEAIGELDPRQPDTYWAVGESVVVGWIVELNGKTHVFWTARLPRDMFNDELEPLLPATPHNIDNFLIVARAR